jgi:hypothetical protein
MQHVTYSDMTARYGQYSAFDLLRSIEQLAQIDDDTIADNLEERFQKAIRALSEINFAV